MWRLSKCIVSDDSSRGLVCRTLLSKLQYIEHVNHCKATQASFIVYNKWTLNVSQSWWAPLKPQEPVLIYLSWNAWNRWASNSNENKLFPFPPKKQWMKKVWPLNSIWSIDQIVSDQGHPLSVSTPLLLGSLVISTASLRSNYILYVVHDLNVQIKMRDFSLRDSSKV